MSLISEYLKKASEKKHSSENDVNIPPMLFDNNQSNLNKKKNLKKIALMGVIFILVISVTGYFFLENRPAKENRNKLNFQTTELMPVQKPTIKHEPIVSAAEQTSEVNQTPKALVPEHRKIVEPDTKHELIKQKLPEVDQLNVNVGVGKVDKHSDVGSTDNSVPLVQENIVNDQANTGFQKKKNKTGYKLYFNLGLSAQKDRDFNKAEEYYKKSLNIKPDYKKSLINLSAIYIKIGDNDKAIALLQQLLKIDPDNINACVNLSIVYLNRKNYKKAEDLLSIAVEKDQNNITSLYNLAVLYQKTDQFDKAIKSYDRIIKIDPENIKSFLACSSIYEKRKDYVKAIENYKKCLATTKVRTFDKLSQKILYRIKLLQVIIEADK